VGDEGEIKPYFFESLDLAMQESHRLQQEHYVTGYNKLFVGHVFDRDSFCKKGVLEGRLGWFI
jgi:hypothetical protein